MADAIEGKIRHNAGLIAEEMLDAPAEKTDEDDEDGFAEVANET